MNKESEYDVEECFEVIDGRGGRGSFDVDDEAYTKMAKKIGIHAYALYVALSYHYNEDRATSPSIKFLAKSLKVSESTIKRSIKILKERKMITVKKVRTECENWNNLYILMDSSVWNYEN